MFPFSFSKPAGKSAGVMTMAFTRLFGKHFVDPVNGCNIYQWRGFSLITTGKKPAVQTIDVERKLEWSPSK